MAGYHSAMQRRVLGVPVEIVGLVVFVGVVVVLGIGILAVVHPFDPVWPAGCPNGIGECY